MKNNRIARVTLSIIYLILLLLPIITYILPIFGALQSSDIQSVEYFINGRGTFDDYVATHYGSWDPIYDIFYRIEEIFTDGTSSFYCLQYLSYIVSITFMWVVVNVLLFIPNLCIKFMRRFDT